MVACLAAVQAADEPAGSRQDAALRQGIALALACDDQIDEDLHFYAECVRAKLGLKRHAPAVRVGLYFQAWLVADLLARQDAEAAALVVLAAVAVGATNGGAAPLKTPPSIVTAP